MIRWFRRRVRRIEPLSPAELAVLIDTVNRQRKEAA